MSLICIFAFVCVTLRTGHWLYLCTHRLHAAAALPQPVALLLSRPSFPAVLTWFHLFATVWLKVTWPLLCSNSGAILRHFQVRLCWIKIDSAVNLEETPSSEFVQCVLWLIRLTKTAESICCAVRHTVTLPRAVWRTIRWPHFVQVLIARTSDAGRHRPSAARPTTPAVRSVNVVYYAVATTRLLPTLAACR